MELRISTMGNLEYSSISTIMYFPSGHGPEKSKLSSSITLSGTLLIFNGCGVCFGVEAKQGVQLIKSLRQVCPCMESTPFRVVAVWFAQCLDALHVLLKLLSFEVTWG